MATPSGKLMQLLLAPLGTAINSTAFQDFPVHQLHTLTPGERQLMASKRKRVRYTLDIHFSVEAEKDAFIRRLSSVRTLLSSVESQASIDNFGLLSAMFDIVEGAIPPAPSAGNERQTTQSFMRNSGRSSLQFFVSFTCR